MLDSILHDDTQPPTLDEGASFAENTIVEADATTIVNPKETLLIQLNELMRRPIADEQLVEYAEKNPVLDAAVIQNQIPSDDAAA